MTALQGTLPFVPSRLRADLTFAAQETPEQRFVVVKDPRTGKFFKLGEADEFIARQFDGVTPLEEIRRRTEARFDATLDPGALDAFARTLSRAGLLDGGEAARVRRPKRIKGSLMRIQLRAFDPDRLFRRMLPSVSWCFTPQFVAAALTLVALGVVIVASSWSDVATETVALLQFTTLPLVMAVAFAVVSAHEFGHGLTCKHFGGRVHELGFMLMYFQPAFYCNVSDAWLFPERWKRVWVSLAGPLVELIVWALATVMWRVTESDTIAHQLSLIVMACSGAHTLLNFNPFLKLDGYYLLSDVLQMPNLRRRAFAYAGGEIKRLFGLMGPNNDGLSTRERRVFMAYGLIASTSTFALLGYVLFTAGDALLEGGQPLVVFLVTTLVGVRFRRRFKRLFGKGSAADDDDEEDDGGILRSDEAAPPSTPPQPAPEQDARKARKERERRARNRRRVLWAALAASIVAFLATGHMTLRIPGAFTILPEHNADARAEIEGIISEVLVTEGQHVKAGEVIARISAREQRAQLSGINADIDKSGARLRLLQLGTSRDSIELARTTVTRASDALRYAQQKLDRVRQLADSGSTTKVELEDAEAAADAAKNNLEEARYKLRVMQAGARPEELQAAQAELARLRSQQQLLSTQLSFVDVRSPASGVIATPARALRELRGQLVNKGALIAKVFEMRTLTIEIVVPEKDIADIREGNTVLVRTRAYPGRTFTGHVVAIATAMQGTAVPSKDAPPPPTTPTPVAKSILVTTEIENPNYLLKPGMSGQAKILCGDRLIRDLIARRFMRSINLQVWSWW
jgi:putative peptide zinc metalloprotease protein